MNVIYRNIKTNEKSKGGQKALQEIVCHEAMFACMWQCWVQEVGYCPLVVRRHFAGEDQIKHQVFEKQGNSANPCEVAREEQHNVQDVP